MNKVPCGGFTVDDTSFQFNKNGELKSIGPKIVVYDVVDNAFNCTKSKMKSNLDNNNLVVLKISTTFGALPGYLFVIVRGIDAVGGTVMDSDENLWLNTGNQFIRPSEAAPSAVVE